MNKTRVSLFFILFLWICSTFLLVQYHTEKVKQVKNSSFHEGFKVGNASGFSGGWKNGFEEGNRTGYIEGWEDSRKFSQFSGFIQRPERSVNFTGNFSMNGYLFVFKEELGDFLGYTWTFNDTVVLESGRTAEEIEGTCDHEIVHNFFPLYNHPEGREKFNDPIYNYSDDMEILLCDKVVAKALEY